MNKLLSKFSPHIITSTSLTLYNIYTGCIMKNLAIYFLNETDKNQKWG
jgi:hypothetical protein